MNCIHTSPKYYNSTHTYINQQIYTPNSNSTTSAKKMPILTGRRTLAPSTPPSRPVQQPRPREEQRRPSSAATAAAATAATAVAAAAPPRRATGYPPPTPTLLALGSSPSFRDLQRQCAYLQGLVDANQRSASTLQTQLEERTHQYERCSAELDSMRRDAAMQREAAAAWRAERESLLALKAAAIQQTARVRKDTEATESKLREQHSLLLEQQRQLREERAARMTEMVASQGLQQEVRQLQLQLERAAAEHALQRRQALMLGEALAATQRPP